MDPLVYLQSSSCNGGEAALATHVESLASVFRHVDIQCTGVITGVVTPGALEVLHPCVGLHVSPEAAGSVTWELTLLTVEWLLPTVSKQVTV